jgi:hypothetical protein
MKFGEGKINIQCSFSCNIVQGCEAAAQCRQASPSTFFAQNGENSPGLQDILPGESDSFHLVWTKGEFFPVIKLANSRKQLLRLTKKAVIVIFRRFCECRLACLFIVSCRERLPEDIIR